jgi:hypothetical protein
VSRFKFFWPSFVIKKIWAPTSCLVHFLSNNSSKLLFFLNRVLLQGISWHKMIHIYALCIYLYSIYNATFCDKHLYIFIYIVICFSQSHLFLIFAAGIGVVTSDRQNFDRQDIWPTNTTLTDNRDIIWPTGEVWPTVLWNLPLWATCKVASTFCRAFLPWPSWLPFPLTQLCWPPWSRLGEGLYWQPNLT